MRTLLTIGLVFVIVAFVYCGRVVNQAFADVDTARGFVGCAYNADK